ncbi:M48 family metallopeptidase [Celeribacter litoreus]|uniref:M48 family metallopeptidase n=1 Tax=Celeribacter litoreus TaxID=2876714 RepID=UPI001CC979CB|nr:SprT family zinc-dependent metalloprotease [Celeribacter litoreus]MCA0042634.1 M48 family metallopeptidase [Celeribacter litoreus]
MGTIVLDGDRQVKVVLRRSSRARRMSLRVSRLDGRVTLTLPNRVPASEGQAFVEEKRDWILSQVEAQVPQQALRLGALVPFLGTELELVPGAGRSARLNGQVLEVPGDEAMVPTRVKAFLKVQAQTRLRAASDYYARVLGVSYGRISIRDTRSRWGSCTSDGNLMYSWRLVMAPEAVLNYVAAHEVAHRLEMNHSERFWAQVARACPEYETHRQWLRVHGHGLHAWRFEVD